MSPKKETNKKIIEAPKAKKVISKPSAKEKTIEEPTLLIPKHEKLQTAEHWNRAQIKLKKK